MFAIDDDQVRSVFFALDNYSGHVTLSHLSLPTDIYHLRVVFCVTADLKLDTTFTLIDPPPITVVHMYGVQKGRLSVGDVCLGSPAAAMPVE